MVEIERKKKLETARQLFIAGDMNGTRSLLKEVISDGLISPAVFSLMASACWELNDLQIAAYYFGKASELNPDSEAISLGLFHCLWNLGKEDDAFEEMKRFLKTNKSEEYTRLLSEINNDA
ncbi:tetratricopeptide repeat protein [Bremerella sp. T1]|uniref:tetratricopeptide repeat protein n=1 Tax=Bremerella sp. TYQ1 TaxID=3119568 RepID=UPI001CCE2464|nr:tetratricopeptide repeat protein [Bremerella volcania]UBM38579.1 tetratricopeptide repeat protein [Bremerella volcania]